MTGAKSRKRGKILLRELYVYLLETGLDIRYIVFLTFTFKPGNDHDLKGLVSDIDLEYVRLPSTLKILRLDLFRPTLHDRS